MSRETTASDPGIPNDAAGEDLRREYSPVGRPKRLGGPWRSQLKRSNRKRRGFTLIEILIVVSIIGTLAGIVIPQFTGAGEEAIEAAIRSDLQRVRAQIQLYRAKNVGELPASINDLVDQDYIHRAPEHPSPGVYEYDPTTGVISSSFDPTW